MIRVNRPAGNQDLKDTVFVSFSPFISQTKKKHAANQHTKNTIIKIVCKLIWMRSLSSSELQKICSSSGSFCSAVTLGQKKTNKHKQNNPKPGPTQYKGRQAPAPLIRTHQSIFTTFIGSRPLTFGCCWFLPRGSLLCSRPLESLRHDGSKR